MRITNRWIWGAVVVALFAHVGSLRLAAQDANKQIPDKFIGKWIGESGKMRAESRHQTGTAIVREDFGHTIDQFEFEVAKDGTIKGTGKATFYFNVFADADLLVTKVAPSAQLEGKTQQVEFTITGKMTPEGKLTVSAEPKKKLTLINAGKKTTMSAWNVLGPFEQQVKTSGPRPVIEAAHVIDKHNIKLDWKAHRDMSLKVSFYVDAFIPFKRIPAPPGMGFSELKGDDRDFKKGGSARVATSLTIDLYAEDPLVGKPEENVGSSEGYYKEKVAGELTEITEKGQASGKWDGKYGMNTVVKRVGDEVLITIDAKVSLPFKVGLPAVLNMDAPQIDYHYKIVAWRSGKDAHYKIQGKHDGFPAYSIYVNDELIHKHKPKDPNDNPMAPLALYGDGDIPIDLKGKAK